MTELPPGWRLERHAELASTSDVARTRLHEGAGHGLVVMADRQTGGHGRQRRVWTAPAGNLNASLLIHHPSGEAHVLPYLAGVALADAVALLRPDVPPMLKWPNDLMLDGAKAAGILIEVDAPPAAGAAATYIIGFGVNLATAPEGLGRPVTCLSAHGVGVGAGELLARLMAAFDHRLSQWRDRGFGPIRDAWLARAHPVGARLAVRDGTDMLDGVFAGLDRAGRLVLEVGGEKRHIAAGEVIG